MSKLRGIWHMWTIRRGIKYLINNEIPFKNMDFFKKWLSYEVDKNTPRQGDK